MKRDDARKRIDEGLEKLATALSEGRSEELEAFLKIASRFHRYSFGNLLLILMQKPDASHVAGFRRWKELGRFVKKGEAGIGILAPLRYRKKNDEDDEAQVAIAGFKVVHVFDISQTEGEELPEFTAINGEVGTVLERLEAVIAKQGIEVVTDILPLGTLGLSHGGKITLRAGLTRAERLSVLVHEYGHELIHDRKRRRDTSKQVKECEAEATACVVLSALGVDSCKGSSDYIQLYQGDTETLADSLEVIQKTAFFILQQIEHADAVPEQTEQQEEQPPECNHTLYVDDIDSTWSTVAVENGTRIECSACKRFYGSKPNASEPAPTLEQVPEAIEPKETTEERELRIGRVDYEDRREGKIERYAERAEKARAASEATHAEARRMAGAIPFGQPILVGHHSEKRDRNYRERIHNKFGKSFKLADKAKHYESRAASTVENHAISSDDPQALLRLREKLEGLEASQSEMKAINAAWRKAKKPKPADEDGWKLVADALPEVSAGTLAKLRADMAQPWHIYDAPFPPYALANNSGNLRNVKLRIAELEREGQVTETTEVDRGICTVIENTECNRIQLVFPGKPPEEVRAVLKQNGFRRSRREGAWQRLLNDAGRRAVDWALSQIQKESSDA